MDKTRNEQAIQALQPLRERLDMAEQRYPDDEERLAAIEGARFHLQVASSWARTALFGDPAPIYREVAKPESEGDENGPQIDENSLSEAQGEGDGRAEQESGPTSPQGERPGAGEPQESLPGAGREAGEGEKRPLWRRRRDG